MSKTTARGALALTFGAWVALKGFPDEVLRAQDAPPKAAEIVAVSGCLKESTPDAWTLESATDPVASSANAPTPKELASLPRTGKNSFRLIGVSIFDLPAHKDHTVVIKGLQIKASPTNRLNITSVTMVAPTCPPPAPK
jgi:hypothetical protein